MPQWAHPTIRRGLVGAWSQAYQRTPSAMLADTSGFNRHLSHVNFGPVSAVWSVRDGVDCITYGNGGQTSETASLYGQAASAITRPLACVVWASINDLTKTRQSAFSDGANSAPKFYCDLNSVVSGTSYEMRLYSGGYSTASAAITPTLNRLHCYAWVWHPDNNVDCYFDGRLISTVTLVPGGVSGTTLSIGSVSALTGAGFQWFGEICEVLYFNRLLTGADVRLLSSRPNYAHEVVTRGRSRNIVAGGGVTQTGNLMLLGVG